MRTRTIAAAAGAVLLLTLTRCRESYDDITSRCIKTLRDRPEGETGKPKGCEKVKEADYAAIVGGLARLDRRERRLGREQDARRHPQVGETPGGQGRSRLAQAYTLVVHGKSRHAPDAPSAGGGGASPQFGTAAFDPAQSTNALAHFASVLVKP
ncbi:hypothetical protein [Streptomyces sp. NPDC020681]|uniref:hypothetical protein n=1 Tax=Streptomyces sp. NPDC020681 TaxID=3365083 RepID=UPI00378C07C2